MRRRQVWERWWAALSVVVVMAAGLSLVGGGGALGAPVGTPIAGPVTPWAQFLCQGDETCVLADVTGDGRDDAVAFVRWTQEGDGRGDVWVGVSNGTTFDVPVKWSESLCIADETCELADVNNDGRADVVTYGRRFLSNVWVALSTGSGFAAAREWSSIGCGFQRGETCKLADVNNDDRADLVAFTYSPANAATHGDVTVSLSSGTGFAAQPVQWAESMCLSARVCQLGDVNGDGNADLLTFIRSSEGGTAEGDVLVSLSNGSNGFSAATRWSDWACVWSDVCEVGDVNGDGLTDVVVFSRPNGPGASNRNVWVALSSGSAFGPGINTAKNLCFGTQVCVAGDVNGDEQDDAVAFVKSTLAEPGFANIEVALTESMPAPVLQPVTVSGTSVSLSWTDQSVSEDGFDVIRRITPSGALQTVGQVPTRNRAQLSGAYTFTDTIQTGQRACYSVKSRNAHFGVNYSHERCTSALTMPAVPTPRTHGELTLPDSVGGSAGVFASVAIGSDGLPIVAHRNNGLRVSHCNNATCSTWTNTTLDTASGVVGDNPSIKIGADGLPLISYRTELVSGSSTYDLKVAHCNNVACTSATVTTVDSAARVDETTSLTIGADGLGLIAYIDHPVDGSGLRSTVKVAHCLNAACTSFRLAPVDGVFDISPDLTKVGITTGQTGFGLIAYEHAGSLRVAACTNADCSQSIRSSLDITSDTASVRTWTSIALGRDGLPLIAYRQPTQSGSGLAVAHCLNVYCTDATANTLETEGTTPIWSNLAIGGDGLGVITYHDDTSNDLWVAHCTDIACSSATRTLVDAFDDTGRRPAVAIGNDGLPILAYQGPGPAGLTLRVTQCANADCTGIVVAPF